MINRRKLLANAGAAGLFTASGMGSMLSNFGAHAAVSGGYKALVCVFLNGGLDHYDTILPYDQPSHDTFTALRQSIYDSYGGDSVSNSRARDNLLQLAVSNASDFGSRQYAVPADMAPLQNLFNNGQAAIVGNVGPLLEPVTRAQYDNNKNLLPPRLFSHNDQRSNWMALKPEGASYGWGGMFADAHLSGASSTAKAFSAVGVDSNSVFLSGLEASPYKLTRDGAQEFGILTTGHVRPGLRLPESVRNEMQNHFGGAGLNASNLFVGDVKNIHQAAVEANTHLNNVMATAPALSTVFPSSGLGKKLRGVAETISVRSQLDANRQVFFVSIGGFDTHAAQAASLPSLQREVAEAIAAFYQSTVELGIASDVTLFTASDFGRTLTANESGTDHGWGGHQFVVGGAVRGGEIYGDMPPYELDHDHDAGRGRLIPTTSVEQYAATLGKWFGLSNSELNSALPNLSNFSQSDLMFL